MNKTANDYTYSLEYKIYNTKGRLAWQYNPFRNYRLKQPRFKVVQTVNEELEYTYYFPISISGTDPKRLTSVFSDIRKKFPDVTIDFYGKDSNDNKVKLLNETFLTEWENKLNNISEVQTEIIDSPLIDFSTITFTIEKDDSVNYVLTLIYQNKYQLVEFDTEELDFQITNPVSIIAQPSYDGSVNLILNDGLNIPRLINSRFSATGNDTYSIEDRTGNDDTNIYDQGIQFDIDTSLYKQLDKIPKINFLGVSTGGTLKVGNYHFYFKLMDADGNESDFIGQSQLVSVFIGTGTKSVQTGQKNQNSHKLVKFNISNIDSAYPYVSVYYSRATAESTEQIAMEYKHLFKKYLITNAGTSTIIITGYEQSEDTSERDLNLTYNIVDSVKTHAQNQNRLFLGNVHKTEIPYDVLTNLSLQFCATVDASEYECSISKDYVPTNSKTGYYNPINIHDKVGYWPNEFYRFGIVYIMKSGELSPVFNIRGALEIKTAKHQSYQYLPIYDNEDGSTIKTIHYNSSTYIISENDYLEGYTPTALSENVKGVVKLYKNLDSGNDYNVLGIKIALPEFEETYSLTENGVKTTYTKRQSEIVLSELDKYVKGFFFVRQRRIPTVLCQGLAIGQDKNSYIPLIPVNNNQGIMKAALSNHSKNHIVYNYNQEDDSQSINYITEGFLQRYTFKFKKKSSSLWSKIGSVALVAVGVAAIATAVVFTGGAAGVLGAAFASALASASATAIASAMATVFVITAAALTTTAVVTTATIGVIQEVALATQRIFTSKISNGWETTAPSGYKIVEDTSKSRLLGGTFTSRVIIKNPDLVDVNTLLCPDYTVDQPYYNTVLVGDSHLLMLSNVQPKDRYFYNSNTRHFYIDSYTTNGPEDGDVVGNYTEDVTANIIGVPSDTSIVGTGDAKFRSKAGLAEEAFRYVAVGNEYKKADPTDPDSDEDIDKEIANQKINSDIVRGVFGPYVGIDGELSPLYIYNIMIAGYSESNYSEYLQVRAEDNSEFFCISKRFDLQDYLQEEDGIANTYNTFSEIIYSGDCYICQFTQRLIRNFNSPSLPYNDEIIDDDTWQENYDPNNSEKNALINLGDVNAVQIGMWVTFKLRSSKNLNVRTIDESYVDEVAQSGHPRSYYPYTPMSVAGSYKLSEAEVYNKGFSKSVGSQYQYELPDVPWIKNWFGTRIMYSDIHVNDAFKNGYRIFRPTNYRDYTREYGTITKLLSVGSYLVAVMEHGILRMAVSANNSTTDSMINYKNVLPETPDVISSDYGSEWADSVIQTPNGIYGVDTHAKKIWKTDGSTIELLSENSMQRFLNENLKLKEREKTPILGRRNVKTIYNQFKGDVMFTFYNINDYDEIAWNLCYNEKLEKFITFYSWIPSFMENINNIPFSFNRETSRMFSTLYSDDSSLIKISKPVYSSDDVLTLTYNYVDGYKIQTFEIDTTQRLGKYFEIECAEGHEDKDGNLSGVRVLKFKQDPPYKGILNVPIKLVISADYTRMDAITPLQASNGSISQEYNIIIPIVDKETYDKASVEFWVHGQAGIIDDKEKILPTTWYGETHPFEFEFVVADNLQYQKIFDNLQIIANKAEPESFHYEIVGDCYDFSKDKINMYYRQEALKYLYNYNGCDISYNTNYSELKSKLHQNKRSADLPKTYYARQDTINKIYHDYKSGSNPNGTYEVVTQYNDVTYKYDRSIVYTSVLDRSASFDYDHLSGAEIVWYELENEFRIWQHCKAVNLANLSQEYARNMLKANCNYMEDKWFVTINPLIICYKNEDSWEKYENGIQIGEPPITIYNHPFPEDLENNEIPGNMQIDTNSWLNDVSIYGMGFGEGQNRKEAELRGRYIKIKIRYSGKELAIIDFVNTLYRISYA